MAAQHLARVFDRTKILFSSGNDLGDIRDQAGAVCTIRAMEFFDEVQIAEVLPVKHDIVAAPHFRYLVNREASPLIQAYAQIQHQ